MHSVIGVILLVIALFAIYYMYQGGFLMPITSIFSDINTGYNEGYGDTPQGATSTAYRSVRIGFVALAATSTLPSEVDLVAHPRNGGLTLTGWVISTEKGKFPIPKVQNLYSPSTAGVPPENVFVRDGDRLRIYTGKSPSGQNERITQSEYRIWLGDFMPSPHGTIVLRDNEGLEVDRYKY
jgi:hypothetical protein